MSIFKNIYNNPDPKKKKVWKPGEEKSFNALDKLDDSVQNTLGYAGFALPDSTPDNPSMFTQTAKGAMTGFATGGILGGLLGAGAGLYKGATDTQINQETQYNKIMQLLSNTQNVDKGSFVPKLALGGNGEQGKLIQAELGEKIMTAEGDIYDVKAKKLHKDMKKDEVTDYLNPGDYTFSDRIKLKRKDAEKIVLSELIPNYSDKYGQDYEKITLDKFFSKDEHTLAELAEKIKKMYPLSVIDKDAFATQANNFNKESRLQALSALAAFNELKKNARVGKVQSQGNAEELAENPGQDNAMEESAEEPAKMAWGGGKDPYGFEYEEEVKNNPLKALNVLPNVLNLNNNNDITNTLNYKFNTDNITSNYLNQNGGLSTSRATVANPMAVTTDNSNPYATPSSNAANNTTVVPPVTTPNNVANNSNIDPAILEGAKMNLGDIDPDAPIPAWGESLNDRKKKLQQQALEKEQLGKSSYQDSNRYLGFSTMSSILGNLFQSPQVSAPQYDQRFIDASPQEVPQVTIDYLGNQINKGVQPLVQGSFENNSNFAQAAASLSGIPAKIADAQSKVAIDIATQNNTLRQAYLDKKSGINEKQVLANTTAENSIRENSNYITAQIAGAGSNYFNQRSLLVNAYRDYQAKAKDDSLKEMDNANLIAWLTGKKIPKKVGENATATATNSSNPTTPSTTVGSTSNNSNNTEEKSLGKDPYRRDAEDVKPEDKNSENTKPEDTEPIELELITSDNKSADKEDSAKSSDSSSTTGSTSAPTVTPGTEGEQPLAGDTYPSPGEEISKPLPVAPKDITQQPSQETAKEPAKSTDPIDNKFPVVEKGKENTSSPKKEEDEKEDDNKDYKGEKREVEDPETGKRSTKVVKRQYKDDRGVHIEYEDGSSENRFDVRRKGHKEKEYSVIVVKNSNGEVDGMFAFKKVTDQKLIEKGIVEERTTTDKYGTVRKEYLDKNRKIVGKSTIVKSGSLTPQEYEPSKVVKEGDRNKVVSKQINEQGKLVISRRDGSYEIVTKLRKNKYQVTVYDSKGGKVKTVIVKNKK